MAGKKGYIVVIEPNSIAGLMASQLEDVMFVTERLAPALVCEDLRENGACGVTLVPPKGSKNITITIPYGAIAGLLHVGTDEKIPIGFLAPGESGRVADEPLAPLPQG